MKRFNKSYLIPISLGLILFTIISVWLFYEMAIFGNRTMRIIKQEGQIASKAIKGIIQSQMYIGRISKGRLEFILSNIVDKTILKYVCIRKGDKIIFETDNIGKQFLQIKNKNITKNNIFYFTTSMELETPPPKHIKDKLWMAFSSETRRRIKDEERSVRIREKKIHRNDPENFIDFRRSKQTLIIGIDISIFDQQLRSEFYKSLLLYIIACIAIIVFILAWIYMIKNSKLKLKYIEVKAKTNKLEELSLAATGLAHEIKNPLGIIRGLTQEITHNSDDMKLVENIAEKVIDETDIATERLSDFMNYARHKKPNLKNVNIKTHIEELLEMLQYEFNEKSISVNTVIENINILTDSEFLTQIVINILINSINACKDKNRIKIKVFSRNKKGIIEISDNGSGIDKDLIGEIFKPYISGNPKGHGIGLAIVKKLTDELEWNIEIKSTADIGTKTIISNIKIVE